jgi:hypothetical protein
MMALLHIVPVGLAALGWYGLYRLNRRTRWFRLGELIFWDVVFLILLFLVWLRWY